MKTAVSIPDVLFDTAERTAQQLGIPRSQLFARALEEFIKNHQKENITEKLNMVYFSAITDSKLSEIGLETLRKATQDDTW